MLRTDGNSLVSWRSGYDWLGFADFNHDLNVRKILYGVTGSMPLGKRGGIGSNPIGESKISYIVIGESYFNLNSCFWL